VAKKRKRKKAPKGYHYMPDGRLMKDSAHGKKKKSTKR
jgi:elongation factor P hydroxylase